MHSRILFARLHLSGGINCSNWRNSIEFKFYGNQFHCARGLLFFFKCPFNSFVISINRSAAAFDFSQSFSIRFGVRGFLQRVPRYLELEQQFLGIILRAFFSLFPRFPSSSSSLPLIFLLFLFCPSSLLLFSTSKRPQRGKPSKGSNDILMVLIKFVVRGFSF